MLRALASAPPPRFNDPPNASGPWPLKCHNPSSASVAIDFVLLPLTWLYQTDTWVLNRAETSLITIVNRDDQSNPTIPMGYP